jgi:hypothetical protein
VNFGENVIKIDYLKMMEGTAGSKNGNFFKTNNLHCKRNLFNKCLIFIFFLNKFQVFAFCVGYLEALLDFCLSLDGIVVNINHINLLDWFCYIEDTRLIRLSDGFLINVYTYFAKHKKY